VATDMTKLQAYSAAKCNKHFHASTTFMHGCHGAGRHLSARLLQLLQVLFKTANFEERQQADRPLRVDLWPNPQVKDAGRQATPIKPSCVATARARQRDTDDVLLQADRSSIIIIRALPGHGQQAHNALQHWQASSGHCHQAPPGGADKL